MKAKLLRLIRRNITFEGYKTIECRSIFDGVNLFTIEYIGENGCKHVTRLYNSKVGCDPFDVNKFEIHLMVRNILPKWRYKLLKATRG